METKSNFIPYPAQQRVLEGILDSNALYHTLVSSRQIGKTLMGLNLLLYYAINYPGTINYLVSPSYAQSKKCFMELQIACENNPIIKNTNGTDLIMMLHNGSIIRMLTAGADNNNRGITVTGILIIDEAAFIPNEIWQKVFMPAVGVSAKKVLFISTPNGYNWFYDMYNMGEDPSENNYQSYRISAYENPYLSEEFLRDVKKTIPDKIFQQEYLGIFVEGGGSVFEYAHTATIPFFQPIPDPNEEYFAGLDLAIANDWTVLTILNSKGEVVHIYRENKTSWEQIVGKIIALIKKWNCRTLVELNSIGSVVYEQLTKACPGKVTPFTTTIDTKKDVIENLKLSFSESLVKIPTKECYPELHIELSMFSYKILSSGKVSYSAPGGGHDDIIMSLAFAEWNRKSNKNKGKYATLSGNSPWNKFVFNMGRNQEF